MLPQLGDSSAKLLGLFAQVHSVEDVDLVKDQLKSLPHHLKKGITVDVKGRASFAQAKEIIERARAEKLGCRCNLIDCFDFQAPSSQTHHNALQLATLVGDLADLDVSLIMLRLDKLSICSEEKKNRNQKQKQKEKSDQQEEEEEENKREALQVIADEVYGLDCVGPPLRARFGIYSSSASASASASASSYKGLEEWAQREMDMRNSLEFYD